MPKSVIIFDPQPQASAPSNPRLYQLYVDDGTNTDHGLPAIKQCISTSPALWQQLGAPGPDAYEYVYVDAGALVPLATNGGDPQTPESTTYKNTRDVIDLDGTAGANNTGFGFKFLKTPKMLLDAGFSVLIDWKSASDASNGDKVRFMVAAGCVKETEDDDIALGDVINADDEATGASKRQYIQADAVIPSNSDSNYEEYCEVYVEVSRDYDYTGGGTGMSGKARVRGVLLIIPRNN